MANAAVKHLSLKAETAEDLSVISSAVQDSILRVQGILYNSKTRSLMLGLQRYRHEDKKPSRIISALRFDSVLSMKSIGIDRSNEEAFLVLLSISFEPTQAPSGDVILSFSGGGKIKLDAECLEVMLLDQGEAWSTKSMPDHDN